MVHVLVIGPGAIGTTLALALHDAGHQVTMATHARGTAPDTYQWRRGRRTRTAALPTLRQGGPASLTDVALVLHATRCQARDAWQDWAPHIGSDVPIVWLQNGHISIPPEPRHVPGCVVFPATRTGPGQVVQTGPGEIVVGLTDALAAQKAHAILASAWPTRLGADMEAVRWTKLLINACITSLGVVAGQGLGGLLRRRDAREVFLAIVAEGHAVATATGIRMVPLAGFRPAWFAPRPMGLPVPLRHVVLRIVGAKARKHRSSSLQALERGEATEVDHLNGAIVDAGRAHAVPTPVNEAIVAAIHAIEAGAMQPGDEALACIVAAVPRKGV